MLIKIGLTFLSFIILDTVWFLVMGKRFYQPQLAYWLRSFHDFRLEHIISLLLIYLLLSLGVSLFVLTNNSYRQVLLHGALFGLIVYGTFNLVNFIALKNWPFKVLIVDILWGIILCAMVSLMVYFILKK